MHVNVCADSLVRYIKWLIFCTIYEKKFTFFNICVLLLFEFMFQMKNSWYEKNWSSFPKTPIKYKKRPLSISLLIHLLPFNLNLTLWSNGIYFCWNCEFWLTELNCRVMGINSYKLFSVFQIKTASPLQYLLHHNAQVSQ